MSRYPHLLKADSQLWDEFLLSKALVVSYYDYDVAVGNGRDPGPEYEKNIRQMGLDLSRRRIDAVGTAKDAIYIIEITQQAGLKALGQLHAYPVLYKQTFSPSLRLVPILVARRFSTDAKSAFDNAGIKYYLLPESGNTS